LIFIIIIIIITTTSIIIIIIIIIITTTSIIIIIILLADLWRRHLSEQRGAARRGARGVGWRKGVTAVRWAGASVWRCWLVTQERHTQDDQVWIQYSPLRTNTGDLLEMDTLDARGGC
jgi:hypothetical protein